MLIPCILFVIGLLLLIKGGDWFVDAATAIAHHYHVSELIIGATIVSIGTTLPEVMVSATSAVMGHGEIAYGNAVGSIICNTALIAAITVAVRPPKVDGKAFSSSVAFFFIAAIVYSAIAVFSRSFSRASGILLLLIFIVYIVMTVLQARKSAIGAVSEEASAEEGKPLWKQIVMLIVGAALIAFGADLLVKNATIIAKAIGIPESVIGLTLVALGTSLPELVTAITSLVKGHSSLSLGNIIGANLFNIVLVSGVATTLSPFDIPLGKTIASYPTSLVIDIPVMLLVMLLLTAPPLVTGRMMRLQGILLLAIYAAFCVFQFAF